MDEHQRERAEAAGRQAQALEEQERQYLEKIEAYRWLPLPLILFPLLSNILSFRNSYVTLTKFFFKIKKIGLRCPRGPAVLDRQFSALSLEWGHFVEHPALKKKPFQALKRNISFKFVLSELRFI